MIFGFIFDLLLVSIAVGGVALLLYKVVKINKKNKLLQFKVGKCTNINRLKEAFGFSVAVDIGFTLSGLAILMISYVRLSIADGSMLFANISLIIGLFVVAMGLLKILNLWKYVEQLNKLNAFEKNKANMNSKKQPNRRLQNLYRLH